jgi:PHD/YefM family antitoxin component YafN of YafNO toxin-antitoxin module
MFSEMDKRFNNLMLSLASPQSSVAVTNNQTSSLIDLTEKFDAKSLEEKAIKLINLLIEARMFGRNLKAAFIEEELDSLG